jgi:alkanesulfonate monooxygenase SsuD/methylene tetrahydromethanopterin reductase-like flavin-dependent oxidoreductase (luciferase family)
MFDGNTMLAAIAARTERVSLGLLVGGVMYRNPALLAKITTGIDVISGGRAFLGVGAAWFEEEHLAYGFDFPSLGSRFEHLEDALNIARAMFASPESSYQGKHHSISDALNIPQPLRGDIPIVVGGSGERKTLRLVAKYADGCNVMGDVDKIRHLMGVLEGHCEDVGRDPSQITRTRLASLYLGSSHEDAMRRVEQGKADGSLPERRIPMVIAGGPDEIAEQLGAFVDAGIEGFTISLPDASDLEMVELAGKTIAPLVGSPVG